MNSKGKKGKGDKPDPFERLPRVADILVTDCHSIVDYEDDEEFRALAEILEWFAEEDDADNRRNVRDAILELTFKSTKAHFEKVYQIARVARDKTAARRVVLTDDGEGGDE